MTTPIIDLHLVRASLATGHDIKEAVAGAVVDQVRCHDLQAGDTVLTPEGNTGRILFIWAATMFAPTMALVQINWFRRSFPLNDLKPANNRGIPTHLGLAGGEMRGDK